MCEAGSGTGRTAHFRAVCVQRGALKQPEVRPWRRHMIGWPIWPAIDLARPCECHATTTHVPAAVEGVCWHHPRPERPRLALCHLCRRMCASQTIYWDVSPSRRELALGADGGCLVLSRNHSKSTRASWCVTNTDTQIITRLRRLRLKLPLRLSAWHTTRARRDPRQAPQPRHAHRPHGAHAGRDARSRTGRASHPGSSSSRRRRWCVQVI